jgi:predicted acylesterase/phospholipase RssA
MTALGNLFVAAFTWGVLDHILQDGRLDIEGVTGASAGAINAIMLTDGLTRGGPTRRVIVLQTFGALQASTASCPSYSAKSLMGCYGRPRSGWKWSAVSNKAL